MNAVEALQVTYGVSITADESMLVIYDTKRTDEWVQDDGTSYGQWDGFFFGDADSYPSVSLKELEFEDFDGWEK